MNLEEILKDYAHEQKRGVDWEARKEEWIAAVNSLYDTVEGWFSGLREQGLMAIERKPTCVYEEYLGDYAIDSLEIGMADKKVILEPVGRNVIGARGRIDLYLRGFKADRLLLLRLEDVEGQIRWEMWKGKLSGFRKPFAKETFEQLLEEWLYA
jgi:hypothetical protein